MSSLKRLHHHATIYQFKDYEKVTDFLQKKSSK